MKPQLSLPFAYRHRHELLSQFIFSAGVWRLSHVVGSLVRDGTIEAGTGCGHELSHQVLVFTNVLLADLPSKGGCRGGIDDDA